MAYIDGGNKGFFRQSEEDIIATTFRLARFGAATYSELMQMTYSEFSTYANVAIKELGETEVSCKSRRDYTQHGTTTN